MYLTSNVHFGFWRKLVLSSFLHFSLVQTFHLINFTPLWAWRFHPGDSKHLLCFVCHFFPQHWTSEVWKPPLLVRLPASLVTLSPEYICWQSDKLQMFIFSPQLYPIGSILESTWSVPSVPASPKHRPAVTRLASERCSACEHANLCKKKSILCKTPIPPDHTLVISCLLSIFSHDERVHLSFRYLPLDNSRRREYKVKCVYIQYTHRAVR